MNPQLSEKMGLAGAEMVRRRHTPEAHYDKLLRLYERLAWRKSMPTASVIPSMRKDNADPKLRVAFIGGRGVISKYSGIESYYEEVGKRLAEMGHEVTVYCRNYFTPEISEHNGMKLVRLPTIRSKHLETVIHTTLSTIHALTQRYDIVHYHALGRPSFPFCPDS